MFFLLKVFVGVPLSCFKRVFQRKLELLNSVDIPSLQGAIEILLLLNLFCVAGRLRLLQSPSWNLPNGWQDEKYVYWNVSVGLKCVLTSRIDVLLNLFPLYTIVSRNVTSFSEISAVNLTVAGWSFACSMKCVICSFPVPGALPEKLGGGVRHTSWNPSTTLDQNLWFSLPYFRPDQKFDTLFQTCLIISSLGQTDVKGNVYTLLLSRIQNSTVTARTRLA